MSGVNVVDAVVLVWLLIGAWQGARHGLTGELGRLLAAALAIFAAWHACFWLGARIMDAGHMTEVTAHGTAFILILVAMYILLRLIGMIFKHLVTFSFKGRLEPIGGAVLGLLTSALLVTALLLVLGHWSSKQAQRWFVEGSLCGRVVQRQWAPLYTRWTASYPALRIPDGAEPDGEAGETPMKPPAPVPEKTPEPAARPAR